MKLPIVVKWDWMLRLASRINGFEVAGIEYIPFVIVVNDKSNKILINHETIHYQQMLETAMLGFYFIYAGHYLWNRLMRKMNHHDAYVNICFEREAYGNQHNLKYLQKRKRFIWRKLFRKN